MKALYQAGNEILGMHMDFPQPVSDGKRPIIKVAYCGICGSDVHSWEQGENIKGLVLGHEFSGTIVDPGDRTDLKAGDRVTCIAISPCGECEYCKSGNESLCNSNVMSPGIFKVDIPGAMAQYFSPARSSYVKKIPDSVALKDAAMIEPAGIGHHALTSAGFKPGETVLIAGGGIIGAMCAQWAKYMGASYVAMTEVNKSRAERIKQLGIVDDVFDPSEEGVADLMFEKTGGGYYQGGGFDVFVDCAGVAPAINFGVSVCKKAARVALVGVNWKPAPINTVNILLKQLTLYGIMSATNQGFDACLDAIASGNFPVEHYHTSTVAFDLDQVQAAFVKLKDPTNAEFKILIEIDS